MYTEPLIKTKLAAIGLAMMCASAARADFNPISLTSGSFNADVVVEAGAAKSINAYTTVTIDAGTNNSGNTFFGPGLETVMPWTGLPPAGSTFNSQFDATRHYKMPP